MVIGGADRATLSVRSVSDINVTARKETARLLAGALALAGASMHMRPPRSTGPAWPKSGGTSMTSTTTT